MTRRHRKWHFWIWLFLSAALAGGLVSATRTAASVRAAGMERSDVEIVPEGRP